MISTPLAVQIDCSPLSVKFVELFAHSEIPLQLAQRGLWGPHTEWY